MGNIIYVKGTMAFPHLAEADENGKYSCCIVVTKEEAKKLLPEINQLIKDNITKKLKNPLRNGDEKEYEDFKGKIFFNAKSKNKIPCVGRNKVTLNKDEYAEKVFGGQDAIFAVTVYLYNFNGKNGISFGLSGVQILETGSRIGGAIPNFEELPPLENESSELSEEPTDTDIDDIIG